nr:helix-turn-helix domain-containing protein [Actinosynnema sp. ALI-1.44]
MPRMTARVFACLLTADTSGLTSATLVDLLRVSPASVSKSIGYLEAMELVARRPDPTGRRERYLIGDDIWLRAWQADTGAHGKIAAAARAGAEAFGTHTPAGTRLGKMGEFFGRLSEQMSDSPLAEGVAYDASTVLAALVYARRPLPADALAAALGWPRERAVAAVAAIHAKPALADPLELQVIEPDTYAVTVRPDRLSAAQRSALN